MKSQSEWAAQVLSRPFALTLSAKMIQCATGHCANEIDLR